MNLYNIISLHGDEIDLYNTNLKLFEIINNIYYPYGEDFFTIDHGDIYINFFRRLGDVYYFIITSIRTNLIVGVACAILRTYNNRIFWYLCDLKIDLKHRGKNLPLQLFIQMAPPLLTISTSGYCISMDPTSNVITKIFEQITLFDINLCNIKKAPKLFIYNISKSIFEQHSILFAQIFGDYKFLSLNKVKNLTLKSNNKRIKLFHLQHGPFCDNYSIDIYNVPDDSQIMFCITENSILVKQLLNFNIHHSASATIFYRNMNYFDWNYILTSEI